MTIIVLISGILISSTSYNAFAMPNLSPQDLYKASEMVFYGQVISKLAGPGPDYYYYQVKVQTYFKNPQTSDSITVAGHKPSEGHVTYPQFEIGDKAIFYINKIDGINTISPYSQKAGDACDVHSFLGPAPLPGEPLFTHGPPASNPRITDVNGNALGRILINQEIVLSYDDVWNNYPESRTIPVSISVQNEDNGKQIFNNTQNLEVQACSFAGNLKWNFVPTEIGNYVAKIDIDNKTKMSMEFSAIFGSTTNPQIALSPLKQFKSGIAVRDITCKEDLRLIIKSEDESPVCVKPKTAEKLVERGWAKEIVTNISSESSNLNQTTNELEIDLSNQTYQGGYPVDVNIRPVNEGSGCKIPSVTVRNLADQSLVFGPTPLRNYTGHCVDPWPITFYAGLEKNALIVEPQRYSVLATLANKTYQKEFTAIPSQYSGKNITADSTQTMPGFYTFRSCLPIPFAPPNNGTLINYTGFELYHRYLAGQEGIGFPVIDDYLLGPGNAGTFVMQVHQGQFPKGANLATGLEFLSENLLNLDNSTVWKLNRPVASDAHPGLIVSYTPSFAKAGSEEYATIAVSVSALENATRGTYWLYLPPGICGGHRVLLTVGDEPLAQPPDLIGYDFASNFGHSGSDVSFELINPGIHTFENCSLNYVSKNQSITLKTFDEIRPGMEYKYYANLNSNPIESGFLECKKPSITKVYPDMWIDTIPY